MAAASCRRPGRAAGPLIGGRAGVVGPLIGGRGVGWPGR